ncbi:hypothetical protein PALB_28770 [Pseudoalteromonas luteoviolacea B = ATCC 29581]|nr:hypothetical protein PALB_28770 [Pseudoalteromonas luteoviolacea B = ATCC 29581]
MIASYEFEGAKCSCIMTFQEPLWRDFYERGNAWIFIDPKNPTQCLHNSENRYKFIKLWLLSFSAIALCQITVFTISS